MIILSIVFVVILLAVVGVAWAHLRSDWRDVLSMRAENKASADLLIGDFVEGPECAPHHGHGHGGDAGGHDFGGFHGGDHGGFDGGGGHH
jgi:hypothetical protein